MRFFGFLRILVRFFGNECIFDTVFGFILYCSCLSVFEEYAVCWFTLLIAACVLLVFPYLSRLAPVRYSERSMKLVRMNNVRSISFNIRLFGGFIRWGQSLFFYRSFIRNRQSLMWTVKIKSMVPYFLLHLTSRVLESCEILNLPNLLKSRASWMFVDIPAERKFWKWCCCAHCPMVTVRSSGVFLLTTFYIVPAKFL